MSATESWSGMQRLVDFLLYYYGTCFAYKWFQVSLTAAVPDSALLCFPAAAAADVKCFADCTVSDGSGLI